MWPRYVKAILVALAGWAIFVLPLIIFLHAPFIITWPLAIVIGFGSGWIVGKWEQHKEQRQFAEQLRDYERRTWRY